MTGLKHAIRTLTKTPFVTAIAIISLALGIGANAAIYSLFDQMLLSALPVRDPDSLVNLASPGPKPGSQTCNQAGNCDEVFSYPMFRDLEKADTAFVGIAAHRLFGANLAFNGKTQSGEGMQVSGSYFPILGVRPVLGRLLGPDDDRNIGGHPVAVLSHRYWTGQLGADPAALNQTIVVNGCSMTIVGVAQPGFRGTTLGGNPAVFVPITMRSQMSPGFDGFENRRSYWAYLFARLKPGATMEKAKASINSVYHGIINDVEAPLQKGMSDQTLERFRAKEITLAPGERGQSSLHGEVQTPLTLLFSITGLVLLIACANIANLMLARGAGRGQEMAIRGSLGASRLQLVRPLLTESLLLAVMGGLASLLVARWTLGALASLLPADAVESLTFGISPSMVLFAGGLSIATGFLFGLYPAVHTSRRDLVTVLKANAGQPSGARSAARFRTALVVAQIALSMTLLVASGLFIRSLDNVSRVDLGLRADNLVVFGVSPELNGYKPDRSLILFERLEEELASIPGVSSVTASLVPVLAGSNWGSSVDVEGFESGPDIDNNSRYSEIGAKYFSTMGTPLLAGREFERTDIVAAPKVAIINEEFAKKFHLDPRQAVGKRMSNSGDKLDTEIVGIVQNSKYSEVKGDVPPLFYRPYRQDDQIGQIYFYVRTAGDSEPVLRAIPAAVARLDPNLPVEELKTLRQQIRENVVLDRVLGTLSASFATLATLLAAVGLYGVLAYTTAQRTREIGLRMALGAESRRILAMVLRQVALMTLVGGVIGLAMAFGLGQAAKSHLFGLEGDDPVVMVLAALTLVTVAFGAGYLPARRASRTDPMQALRYE